MDKMIIASLAKSAKYTSPNHLAWSALYFDLKIIQFFYCIHSRPQSLGMDKNLLRVSVQYVGLVKVQSLGICSPVCSISMSYYISKNALKINIPKNLPHNKAIILEVF